MAKRTVLIVDDELTLLRSLRDALRRQAGEIEVLTAGRADEALELMELTSVDLVVTDFRMPGQDGISFIADISHKYPNTRCILMTAHGDSDTKNKSLAQGAVSFIEKPFDLDFFISEVNRHLSVSGFTGRSLVGFSLLDILQLVSMSQQSVTITVRSNNGVGSLFIEDGVLIHAEVNSGLTGLRAAYEIVSWSDGDIASSRGVTSGTERSISMQLMNFLMEAAKYQDEVKRLRPLNNVKDVVEEWSRLSDISVTAILDTSKGSEVHGVSADKKNITRMQLCKAVLAAHKALATGLAESEEFGLPQEMWFRLGTVQVAAMCLMEGRFMAVLASPSPAAIEAARTAFEEKRNGLNIALSDYADQFGAVESGEFESINFDDVDDAFDNVTGPGDGGGDVF